MLALWPMQYTSHHLKFLTILSLKSLSSKKLGYNIPTLDCLWIFCFLYFNSTKGNQTHYRNLIHNWTNRTQSTSKARRKRTVQILVYFFVRASLTDSSEPIHSLSPACWCREEGILSEPSCTPNKSLQLETLGKQTPEVPQDRLEKKLLLRSLSMKRLESQACLV